MAHNIEDMVYENNRAKAQAFADVQDEQIERQRRRDVAAANRAAYDDARTADSQRRGISSFSQLQTPGGDIQWSRRTVDPVAGTDVSETWGDNPVWAGMSQLAERENAIRAHNQGLERDTYLSGWKLARNNGGRVQQNVLGQISRNLGMDGKTQAVVGAGLAKNGDFVMNIATKGQDGRVTVQPKVISKREMRDLAVSGDGTIVNGADVDWMDNQLVNSGVATNSLSKRPAWEQQAAARQQQVMDKLEAQIKTKMFDYFAKELAKGRDEQSLVDEMLRSGAARDYFSRGDPIYADDTGQAVNDPYERDEKGNVKTDSDGEPIVRNGLVPMRDEKGNVQYNVVGQEQMLRNIHSIVEKARLGDAQQGDKASQLMALYREMFPSQRQISPEEAEIQQRQRQNALDDQRRYDVMRGGPQQLVNYRQDGKWVQGNGWIRDGKVYDGEGREIQGATPADRQGNPVALSPVAQLNGSGGTEADAAQGADRFDATLRKEGGPTVGAAKNLYGQQPPAQAQAQADNAERRAQLQRRREQILAENSQAARDRAKELARIKNINRSMDAGGVARNPGKSAEFRRERAEARRLAREEADRKAQEEQDFDRTYKPTLDKIVPDIKAECAREGRSRGWSQERVQSEIENRVYNAVMNLAGEADQADTFRVRGFGTFLPKRIKDDYGINLVAHNESVED